MEEQKLEIIENGQYKNLKLKSNTVKGIKGIDTDKYVMIEKVYAEGLKIESKIYKKFDGSPAISYSCAVLYEGEECSFFLNEKEHETYSITGGEGDKVKITLTKDIVPNKKTGAEMVVQNLHFELVE